MTNNLKKIAVFFGILLTCGCASKLPEVSKIDNNYSIQDVNTFSVKMDCNKTVLSGLPENFIENYCPLLESNIKLALQREIKSWIYDQDNPEVIIETTLEQIHGGSAAARFWIGFGAGRSVTTAHVKVFQRNKIVAEHRFNETTTMPNIVSETWSNEDAIIQDAPLIAKKIAQFVHNPVAYERAKSSSNNSPGSQ